MYVAADLAKGGAPCLVLLPADVRYFRERITTWGRQHFADFPWRHETNWFHALVAEILLQRTRAEQVIPVYREFVTRFPHPASLAEAGVSQVEAVIAPLGLKWRAKLLPRLGRKLIDAQPATPSDMRSLLEVPGVGPYAAAAFLSLHAGRRAPIVDSNIVRLYGRFFGFHTGPETRRNKTLLQLAELITPQRNYRDFNYALVDFTRAICRPRPHHQLCPLAARCSEHRAASSRPWTGGLAHRRLVGPDEDPHPGRPRQPRRHQV